MHLYPFTKFKMSYNILAFIIQLVLLTKQSETMLVSSIHDDQRYQYIPINSSLIEYKYQRHVSIGDRNISRHGWEVLLNTVGCWGSIDGKWTDESIVNSLTDTSLDYKFHEADVFSFGITSPPLYKKVYSNDDALVTKVYSACGSIRDRKGLNYYWKPPATCQHTLIKFSTKSLCLLLRGRSMIYIGDSLSLHHYESMVNAIGNRSTFGHTNNYDQYWEKYTYCEENNWGKNFIVTYVKWNSIMEDKHMIIEEIDKTTGAGSIIIANWGAFYVPDYRVQQRRREIVHWINSALPNTLFIYRSSNMAHMDCDLHKVPDNQNHNPVPHPRHFNWHWQDFPLQNVLWRDYLMQYHPGKIYLNIFDLIRKRPDQHPGMSHGQDCLHYCIPGPVDTYVILIHSILYYIEYYSHKYIQLD